MNILVDNFKTQMGLEINIKFIYKEKAISEELKSAKDYFYDNENPMIFIIDLKNNSKFINVTFKDNHGNKFEIIVDYDITIYHLLTLYFQRMGLEFYSVDNVERTKFT